MEEINKNTTPIVIGTLIIVAILALAVFTNSQLGSEDIKQATQSEQSSVQTINAESQYKAGTYSTVGAYTSPGGPEEIGVSLTISKDGIIESADVEIMATHPTSKQVQTTFAENYTTQVVGKDIDTLTLTNVSGSSLTPKGFNDALSKIKSEARM